MPGSIVILRDGDRPSVLCPKKTGGRDDHFCSSGRAYPDDRPGGCSSYRPRDVTGSVLAAEREARELGQAISWPVQYLRAGPEGAQARVPVDLKNLKSCFAEQHAVPQL